jgi:hypothetical protein
MKRSIVLFRGRDSRNVAFDKVITPRIQTIYLPLFALVLWSLSSFAWAEIRFQEVTESAGINYSGPTVGASWGDLNGDGYPDLFVPNHRLEGNTSSLYLNQGDGNFIDVANTALVVGPFADLHGAAWADFDNDGDQDLVATAGGGAGRGKSEGRWSYPNHLFVNHNGKLTNEAKRLGVEYPMGRGRTPLWVDVDRDGQLDLLFMNATRPDAKAPSVLFHQSQNRFEDRTAELGLKNGSWSRWDKTTNLIKNAMNFRWKRSPSSISVGNCRFAQLADLTDDNRLDLTTYTRPFRTYSLDSTSLEEITADIVFPNQKYVQDVIIEDLDGDAKNDLFLLRSKIGRWWTDLAIPSPVVQPSAFEVEGMFVTGHGHEDKAIRFQTEGDVTFKFYPQWVPGIAGVAAAPRIRIGSDYMQTDELSFTVSPQQATVKPSSTETLEVSNEVSIVYHPVTNSWALRSSDRNIKNINFIVKSGQPIDHVRIAGYTPLSGKLSDTLLVRRGNRFVSKALSGKTVVPTACVSGVAGDFDNDMDLDLYLVCSGPVANLPNRLYENDGKGNFYMVQEAGGAAGSLRGRGDAVVTADYDLDGFLDLFVLNGAGLAPFGYDGPHQLFRNSGNDNHWIEIDLQGVTSNRDGIGAKVELETGGVTQVRDQGGGMHCYSQNHQRIHFGLGSNKAVDRITVYWPSGIVQHVTKFAGDRVITIKESSN